MIKTMGCRDFTCAQVEEPRMRERITAARRQTDFEPKIVCHNFHNSNSLQKSAANVNMHGLCPRVLLAVSTRQRAI